MASCSARLNSRLRDNRHLVCSTVKDHTHAPDTSEVDKVRLRMELKRITASDSGPPSRVRRVAAIGLPDSVQVKLSASAQRKIIQRARPAIASVQYRDGVFLIPEELQRTLNGDVFYRGTVEVEGGKALLFVANTEIERLCEARFWISDGTFDTVPGEFHQLVTIHASIAPDHARTIPAVYALLTNKTQALYAAMLQKVSEVAAEMEVDLNPPMILTDFEKGLINAFHEEFPEANQVFFILLI